MISDVKVNHITLTTGKQEEVMNLKTILWTLHFTFYRFFFFGWTGQSSWCFYFSRIFSVVELKWNFYLKKRWFKVRSCENFIFYGIPSEFVKKIMSKEKYVEISFLVLKIILFHAYNLIIWIFFLFFNFLTSQFSN